MKERTEDTIKLYEQTQSKWLAKMRDTNAGSYDMAMKLKDTEAATRFLQRVNCADMVLASRYGWQA